MDFIKKFLPSKKSDDRFITSGTYDGMAANILHLEHIPKNKALKILIEGKPFIIIRSDKNHIWIIKNNVTKEMKSK